MRFQATLEQFLHDLRAQKLRTALTLLGISWGTISVIVLLAFGVGLERQSKVNMHGMGDGIVVVFGGRTTKPHMGFPDGRAVNLREDYISLIRSEIPEIADISPEYRNNQTPVRRDRAPTMPGITGIYPIYGEMRNIIPEPGGRFINTLDQQYRRRTAVLGDEVKKLLFGDEPAVGRQIFIGRTPFTVVGVMQAKVQNSSYFYRDKERVFIPASTYRTLFGDRYLGNVIYRPRDAERSEAIESRLYEVLGRRLTFSPDDKDALGVWDTNEANVFMSRFFLGFNIFLAVIGSFTLTVGGIGVANIMYVVVRERTREIGIKRSVGATRSDILRQFFFETFLIVGTGAGIGFLAAVGLVRLLGMIPVQEYVGVPEISPTVAAVTMGLLAVIALLAGFFPARKASRLDPVECLRG